MRVFTLFSERVLALLFSRHIVGELCVCGMQVNITVLFKAYNVVEDYLNSHEKNTHALAFI